MHGGHKLGTSIQQHWQEWTENQVKLSWSPRIPLPCNGNTCGNLESQGPTHGRQGFVFEAFRRLHKRHLLAKWFSQKFSGRGHYSVKGCCRNFGYIFERGDGHFHLFHWRAVILEKFTVGWSTQLEHKIWGIRSASEIWWFPIMCAHFQIWKLLKTRWAEHLLPYDSQSYLPYEMLWES